MGGPPRVPAPPPPQSGSHPPVASPRAEGPGKWGGGRERKGVWGPTAQPADPSPPPPTPPPQPTPHPSVNSAGGGGGVLAAPAGRGGVPELTCQGWCPEAEAVPRARRGLGAEAAGLGRGPRLQLPPGRRRRQRSRTHSPAAAGNRPARPPRRRILPSTAARRPRPPPRGTPRATPGPGAPGAPRGPRGRTRGSGRESRWSPFADGHPQRWSLRVEEQEEQEPHASASARLGRSADPYLLWALSLVSSFPDLQ